VYVGGRVGSSEIEIVIQVSKYWELRVLCVVTESINKSTSSRDWILEDKLRNTDRYSTA
jgi:hypothetical protein